MSGTQEVIRFRGLSKTIKDDKHERILFEGADMTVFSGEWVAIVGASGAGKTTLLSMIGALDTGFGGDIELLEHSLKRLGDSDLATLRSQQIGFVFQDFHLLSHLSVLENVALPLWISRANVNEPEWVRAQRALDDVGLGDRSNARVPHLSGGEQQRVAIARALVTEPRLIVADEPTGNLDDVTTASILDLFEMLRKPSGNVHSPKTVVVATHDPRVAERADRVVRLEGQRLVEERP